jgi:nucleotide-binding universal stress UspA family protein
MGTVLAAIDCTPAARPVLQTALRVGELTGADVEAVHVPCGTGPGAETPESLAAHCGVPCRMLEDPVEPALLDAVEVPAVVAAVLGARSTPGGRRPVGHTALHLLERASKPVVVVPPDVVSPGPIRRLLVPLEGTDASSRPVLEKLWPMIVADVELVVLHVFTQATLPRMLDRPVYDIEMLGGEFLARHLPHATCIELRPGPVAERVAEVTAERGVDLVILSWSQVSSAGRAAVVREVLGRSSVPVLLLPVQLP